MYLSGRSLVRSAKANLFAGSIALEGMWRVHVSLDAVKLEKLDTERLAARPFDPVDLADDFVPEEIRVVAIDLEMAHVVVCVLGSLPTVVLVIEIAGELLVRNEHGVSDSRGAGKALIALAIDYLGPLALLVPWRRPFHLPV
jgi:hypothetical protein